MNAIHGGEAEKRRWTRDEQADAGTGGDKRSEEQGTAVVKYAGPKAIGTGVTAAIRDKFPDIIEVIL
eukprot:gene27153-2387_t